MGPEASLFEKAMQGGAFALLCAILFAAWKLFKFWLDNRNKIETIEMEARNENDRRETDARINSLTKLGIAIDSIANWMKDHEAHDERRFGELKLHVEHTAKETRHDIRNAMTVLANPDPDDLSARTPVPRRPRGGRTE